MPEASARAGQGEEDRRVAALLLRDARSKAELAEEEGSSAYLAEIRRAPRVSGRLLLAEVSQARSHNRRCGVDAAALPPQLQTFASEEQRAASSLDGEFLRRAHELREAAVGSRASGSRAASGGAAAKKRQRVGASGVIVDVAAAEEEEARQAEEDVELANPLLRPPPRDPARASRAKEQRRPADGATGPCAAAGPGAPAGHPPPVMWVSRKLRVRVVDEAGEFKGSHLKKGVVTRVNSARRSCDVELEGETSALLRSVPQELLETVVSRACSRVEIVRGPHSSLLAELLHRDPARNRALVQLGEAEVELPLDDVCEFV